VRERSSEWERATVTDTADPGTARPLTGPGQGREELSLLDWSSVAVGVRNRITWAFTAPSASSLVREESR
jgi:hypothetical protein